MPWSARIWRLAVGVFAGALASFFPRLATVLSGSPTEDVAVFSPTYLLVGVIVAGVVGVVITIIDDDPARPLRDTFMTALGVPTLLMGALSTSATAHNAAIDQAKIRSISNELAQTNKIEVRPATSALPVSMTPGSSVLASVLGSLIPSAQAQATAHSLTIAKPSAFGIVSVEQRYTTVLQEAPAAAELRPLQESLAKRGLGSQIVTSTQGKAVLIPSGSGTQAYSDAVLTALRAKQLGASPYLVPAK